MTSHSTFEAFTSVDSKTSDGGPNANSTPTRHIVSPFFLEHGLLNEVRNTFPHDAGYECIDAGSAGSMFEQGNVVQGVELGQVTVGQHGQHETRIWDAEHGGANCQRTINNLATQPLLDSSCCFDYLLNTDFQPNPSYQPNLTFQPESNNQFNVTFQPDFNLHLEFNFEPESKPPPNFALQQNLGIQPGFNIQPDPSVLIDVNILPDFSLQLDENSQSNPALPRQAHHDISAQPELQLDVNETVLCPEAEVNGVLDPGAVGVNRLHEDIDRDENSAICDSRPELSNTAANDSSSAQATTARRTQTLNVGEVASRKHRYSKTEWEYMRDNHIRRLRVQYKHTVDEIMFELEVIHGFPTS